MAAMDKARRDSGYVLVYVVAVIVILCILVPAACSNSLRNLKAQQASVERMRQLYTAEGQIERFAAEVQAQAETLGSGDYPYKDPATAIGAAQDAFAGRVSTIMSEIPNTAFENEEGAAEALREWSGDGENYQCGISTVSTASDIKINAGITISLKIKTPSIPKSTEENGAVERWYGYEITSCTITYNAYDISAAAETGPEEVTP